jgi:hypothetical protein
MTKEERRGGFYEFKKKEHDINSGEIRNSGMERGEINRKK